MIAPDTIALVRERTNIVTVIQESVPSLKRRGRSWVGLCPFHKEKTPSFHVNPDRGFFHCFGCQESGSAIDFLMKHDGLTFPEAVRALAERCGIEVQEDHKRDTTEVDRQKKHREDLYAVMNVAATFYERQLHDHEQRKYAIDELHKRGLEPTADVIQAFRIGYAPAAWDSLAVHLKAQGLSPALAEQVGLLVPRQGSSGHYDRFRHRLMFGVSDTQGRVVAFSGRALAEIEDVGSDAARGGQGGQSPRDPPPKYVNSPESPIYTKGNLLFGLFQARHAIRHDDVAVIVEGNFDVVSLHARGLANVVAPLGTAFTDEQAKLLRRYTNRVVLCFDGDPAGKKATRAAREPCNIAGLSARVAAMPQGADPDSVARDKGIDAVKDVVSRARELLYFLIAELLDESFNSLDIHAKAARVRAVSTLINDEDDPLARSIAKTWADEFAGRLDIHKRSENAQGIHSPEAFRALEAAISRAVKQAPQTLAPGQVGETPARARVTNARPGRAAMFAIVGAVIEFPELLDDPDMLSSISLLVGDAAKTVAAIRPFMNRTAEGRMTLYAPEFLGHLAEPARTFAAKHLAAPKHESAEAAKHEAAINAKRVREYMMDRDVDDVSRQQRADLDFNEELQMADDVARRKIEQRKLK
jgi:DNA primase